MREHFRQRLVVRDSKPDLSDLNKKISDLEYKEYAREHIREQPEPPAPGEPNVQAPEVHNVFESVKDPITGWNYEVEVESRKNRDVYVIHQDEFGGMDHFEKVTLSYFGGDDVLCDVKDQIVDNQSNLVGDALDKFGHGSGDKNVVYVRNERMKIDLEVVKSEKTYAEEVHGFKHEYPSRRRTPRQN
jgi:hypothetical protein